MSNLSINASVSIQDSSSSSALIGTIMRNNQTQDYFIAGNKLNFTECERDTDVTWHEQVNIATLNANRVLGLMRI